MSCHFGIWLLSYLPFCDPTQKMSTEEELNKQIYDLGEKIKQAKVEKKPKEEWEPILKEMLALKVCYTPRLVSLFAGFADS
jgi:hypothetical protein